MTDRIFKVERTFRVRMVHAAMDWLVVSAVYLGAERLAGWPGATREHASLLTGWALVLFAGACQRSRGWQWMILIDGVGIGAVLLAVNTLATGERMSAGHLAYGMGLLVTIMAGWRVWRDLSADVARAPVAEPGRVLLIVAAALGVMAPMFTPQLVGGTDARWYALMLHDFIEQWRTAGPPVFVGQGEFVWNGAVHPFRSAPVYMHVAGLWDWLTWQSLGIEALQHLTAITAALAGAVGMYAAGVKLAPRGRWAVAAVVTMYAQCSAVLLPFYMAEAYMTYMASAAFVWVFYGNARILVDGRGWIGLAAGLSLAWMSHPPTAMQVTLLTAFLQAGGLVFRFGALRDWGRAVGGGVIFAILSAYYFTGMSELPEAPGSGLRLEMLQIVGLLGGWLAAAQVFLMGRSRLWWLVLAGAVGMLWLTCPPWAVWVIMLVLLLGVVRAVVWRWNRFNPAGREALVMLAGILVTSLAMDTLLRYGPTARPGYPVNSLQWADAWSAFRIDPFMTLRRGDWPFEPGWGLWLGGVFAGLVAVWRRDGATQLLFSAIVLMCPLVLHLPRAGDFLVEHIPLYLRAITAASMHLRTIPVLAVLLAFGTILGIRAAPALEARWSRWLTGAVVLSAVGWYVWQAQVFIQRGFAVTSSAALSAKNWRSENAPMDRFVYDLLPIPSYFSHGKMDPRLEVRLLDDTGNLIYGPPQIVEAMEAEGGRTFALDTAPVPGRQDWLQIEPRFTLEPGDYRLLRFDFAPSRQYAGYLILTSEHGYREYYLPESGARRSFGTGPSHSRVVSLWNSGTVSEHYQMQFALKPGNDLGPGMHFATLSMSKFRPELALIEVKSLNPWRVETRMPWSGQLETPRVFLPGYEVKVDGRRIGPSRVSASPDRLLQIAMPPGEHTVEVRYVGTLKLRLAGLISLVAWIMTLGVLCTPERRWTVFSWIRTLSTRVGPNSRDR